MQPAQIALYRFGLGARPDEAPPADPRGWLIAQIAAFDPAPKALAGLPGTAEMVRDFFTPDAKLDALAMQVGGEMAGQMAGNMAGQNAPPEAKRNPAAFLRGAFHTASVAARINAAAASDTPFAERLVAFWSNHFAVSTDKLPVEFAGPFEREAIRPHVMGRFSDMLDAVERHPAMLMFLDQTQSVGPDSPAARRRAERKPDAPKAGLNENFGREIMELHTLGVRSGYTQADVTEFARALTGWTATGVGKFANRASPAPGEFAFVEALHEPGARTIMGKRYAQDGEAQAQAILDDLAAHPATATHIATKLARHFAGDEPPAPLVDQLARAYTSTVGDLPSVYRALIDAPEPWAAAPAKFLQPWEWLVAVLRGTGVTLEDRKIVNLLTQLGQPTWTPGSPAGWDDLAASWAASDALLRRVDAAAYVAAHAGSVDARDLGDRLFGKSLSDATRQTVARAESPGQALALLLVAPEMLRR